MRKHPPPLLRAVVVAVRVVERERPGAVAVAAEAEAGARSFTPLRPARKT